MFDSAARLGSFQNAAEELNLTQGAVAQQVRNLEKSTNTQLFKRLPRGLALTEEGQAYHQAIQPALQQIYAATRALEPAPSSVTLSVPPSLASKWLVPRLAAFAADHPTIPLHIHASEALADFHTDRIDLAIRQGPKPKDTSLSVHPLAPLDLVAVASPAVRVKPIDNIAEFSNLTVIEDGHARWKALFQEAQLPPPPAILTFNQTALGIDAAINGQGIALTPRLLVDEAVSLGHLQVLWQAPKTNEAFFIAHPKTRQPSRDLVVTWLMSLVP